MESHIPPTHIPPALWNPFALPADLLLLSSEFPMVNVENYMLNEDFSAIMHDDVFSVCSAGTEDSGTSSPVLQRQQSDQQPNDVPKREVKRVKTEPSTSEPDGFGGDDDNDTEENGTEGETEAIRRRRAHLASEKKRRNNLKDAFDDMKQMIPQCRNFPHSKNSKEAVLRKACDYIRYLHIQRAQMAEEIKYLRETIAKNNLEPPVLPAKPVTAYEGETSEDESAFPAGAKMLVLLSLVDHLYEEFMSHVSIRSPEEFSLTLLTFFQQQCRPERLQAMVVGALHTMATNFSPITDGSSCRIRKWLDALNMCNVSGFDEHLSGRVRGILNSVPTHFAM